MQSFPQTFLDRHKRTAVGTLLLGGSVLAGLAPAQAQTFSTPVTAPFTQSAGGFSTTTTNSKTQLTFNRPALVRGTVTVPTGKSGLGSDVAYATSTYKPASTGTYTVSDSLSGYGDDGTASDYVQSLYTPTFSPSKTDPASLATVVQSFNPSAASGGSYDVTLTAGATYIFVDHGYYNKNDTVAAHGPSFGSATTALLFNNPGTTHFIANGAVYNPNTGTESIVPQTVTETLNVTSTATISSFTGISIIGLQHGYVGDLTATLTHNGVSVVLFDHTGATNSAFQGDPGSGAIFSGSNSYTFAPTGSSLAAAPFGSVVPSGTYQATTNLAGGFATTGARNTLSSFVGQSAGGTWTLTVTNHQAGNSGSFLGFSFGINGSPATS